MGSAPTTRRNLFKVAATGASIGSVALVTLGDSPVASASAGASYDVRADFGAKGDGVADDTAAIQGALDAARLAGGGVVQLPPGTYLVSIAKRTLAAGAAWTGLVIGAKTILRGAGRDATKISLRANEIGTNRRQTSAVSIITNYGVPIGSTVPPFDEQITLEDFTLDGNGGNQTDAFNGVVLTARWVFVNRVCGLNVRGPAVDGTLNETYTFLFRSGADLFLRDCHALQTAGPVSNGFAIGPAWTNARLEACTSLGPRFGFNTGTQSTNIVFIGCQASLGEEGYHLESWSHGFSPGPYLFIGCIAGGYAATSSSGKFYALPYDSGQSLGNSNFGWHANEVSGVRLIGCSAISNGIDGARFESGAVLGFTDCQIIGGNFSDNKQVGINFPDGDAAQSTRVTGGPYFGGNGLAPLRISGRDYGGIYGLKGYVPSPPVAGSGAPRANPFPFDAMVYVQAPSSAPMNVRVNGAYALGVQPGAWATVRVAAGENIILDYVAGTPQWVWMLD